MTTVYLICTSPRSGSTMLTEVLSRTGKLGIPNEYFDVVVTSNNPLEDLWKSQLSITKPTEYFDKVIANSTTKNGITGLKLHWHQCRSLVNKMSTEFRRVEFEQQQALNREIIKKRQISPLTILSETGNLAFWANEMPQLLNERFDDVKYIWLRRRNVVAQSISLYRATVTNQWHMIGDKAVKQTPDTVDFKVIDEYIDFFEKSDEGWNKLFVDHAISPFEICYEDLVGNFERIREFIAPKETVVLSSSRLQKMADAWSLQVEEQFHAR